MKNKFGWLIIVLFISAMGLNNDVLGKSLKVSPAAYTWKEIKLDSKIEQKQEMPEHITVFNDSSRPRTYGVKAVKLRSLNAAEEKGFEELPDLSWVSFDCETFEIPAGGKREIQVFLKIPEQKIVSKVSWMFYLEVREKPEGKETVVLACYPKIYVSSLEKRMLK